MSNLCVEGDEHMFRIAICDDERQFRKRIHDILIEYMNENDIEKHSFEIIEQELEIELPSDIKPIVKRVIHTTADFSYAENMYFSPDAIKTALGEIKSGVTYV